MRVLTPTPTNQDPQRDEPNPHPAVDNQTEKLYRNFEFRQRRREKKTPSLCKREGLECLDLTVLLLACVNVFLSVEIPPRV